MINSLHRYTGALSKCLLALIGVILLAGQLTWQPASAATTGITASTTAASTTSTTHLSRQPARDAGDSPDPHCHCKVYLLPDKRHDQKPAFFIPLPLFRLAALSEEQFTTPYSLSSALAAGAVRPACLRGPPFS